MDIEFTDYIAADGTVYKFHVPARIGKWVVSQSGWGMSPIEYITQRGPFQHGETVLDWFLRPRVIHLLIRQQFCDRDGYWAGRAALVNAIRPNRQATPGGVAPGTLRRRLSNGSLRSVDCFIQDGPRFEARRTDAWDEWAFREVLRFVAYDPVIYDPALQTQTFSQDQDELTFPITFPILFSALEASATITYQGTWLSYPTITITGPSTGISITNTTTGEVINISAALGVGDSLIVTLTPSSKTVVKNDGTNMIGSVDPASDLGTWHLAPDPEAPGGANDISVAITGAGPSSGVTVEWYTRYIGI